VLFDEPVNNQVDRVLLVFYFLVEVEVDIGQIGLTILKVELITLNHNKCTFFRSRSESLTLESKFTATMLL